MYLYYSRERELAPKSTCCPLCYDDVYQQAPAPTEESKHEPHEPQPEKGSTDYFPFSMSSSTSISSTYSSHRQLLLVTGVGIYPFQLQDSESGMDNYEPISPYWHSACRCSRHILDELADILKVSTTLGLLCVQPALRYSARFAPNFKTFSKLAVSLVLNTRRQIDSDGLFEAEEDENVPTTGPGPSHSTSILRKLLTPSPQPRTCSMTEVAKNRISDAIEFLIRYQLKY
ncbi:hypothetical protein BJ508DRAFT_316382 [Ascobolus immersus RN42]|uniref:Uncharacterized protein n=1 Tax=Ascobolus immersus RN42 TaxID=1160509 RepID=A0A3N4HAP5_ASCIM|nr:hypothetical protein BJ508DRAFT_316382 [Ascobolus immersus RN42]